MNIPQHTRQSNGHAKSLASSILSRIDAEAIAPIPRARFAVLEGGIWGLVGLMLLLCSVATATAYYTLQVAEWSLASITHDSMFDFIRAVFPYWWVAVGVCALTLLYVFVRQTKYGYRYSSTLLVGISVVVTVCVGVVIVRTPIGQSVDTTTANFIPLHDTPSEIRLRMWDQPERGILSGTITSVSLRNDEFTLRSPSNELHTVRMDSLDVSLRGSVRVGAHMRVIAPLVVRREYVSADSGVSTSEDAITSTNEARYGSATAVSGSGDTDSSMESATLGASSADVKDMKMRAKAPAVQEASIPPVLLREACAVLPLDGTNTAVLESNALRCGQTLREVTVPNRTK